MDNETKKIVNYLNEHGRMSGRDICDDCDVSESDVEWAEQQRAIVRTTPAPGGSGPWYQREMETKEKQIEILESNPCPECGTVEILDDLSADGYVLATCNCADRPWDTRDVTKR